MQRSIWFLFLLESLYGSSLNIEEGMGYSTVTVAGGTTAHDIFINPANLAYMRKVDGIRFSLGESMALTPPTFTFLTELESASNDLAKISRLLQKNIGSILSLHTEMLLPFARNEKAFQWQVGLIDAFDGYFIPHSGFGSKGAMESSIQRYTGFVGTVSTNYEQLDYGVNLKIIQKSSTQHNYSIAEMVEMNGITDYFENRYTQNEKGVGVDLGVNYHLGDEMSLGLSVLNIGDMCFDPIGTLPMTTNIGLSKRNISLGDHDIGLDIAYLDLFSETGKKSLEEDLTAVVSSVFWNNSLKVHSGVLHGGLLYGIKYDDTLFSLALESYVQRNIHWDQERYYQLSLALQW